MEQAEGANPKQQEKLPHEENRAIIGFTKSPEGMDVIGMTFGGRDWILLATMESMTADRARAQLKEELGIDSLPGLPFDWRSSLRQRQLVLVDSSKKFNKPVGVYIPADKFDQHKFSVH